MYYKLYHNIFSKQPPEERRELFSGLYKKYGVELIGVFRNIENHLEYYMLTAYRDETHYKEFIAKIKEIPEYVEMTKKVSAVRLSSSIVNLEMI